MIPIRAVARGGLGKVRALPPLAALLGALALVAACGEGREAGPPPPAQEPGPPAATEPPAETEPSPTAPDDGGAVALPRAVEEKRNAILAAARARDYAALGSLLDPATFSYSFGESGDPVGYWRKLEDEGHVPILGDILPVVLSTRPAEQDGVFVWPAAHAKAPSRWTEEDLADLRRLYSEEDLRGFREFGGYAGYRAGIREDGTWLFFVAGD